MSIRALGTIAVAALLAMPQMPLVLSAQEGQSLPSFADWYLSQVPEHERNPDFVRRMSEAQVEVVEHADFSRWYISPGIGRADFEGDEPLKDGFYLTIRLGRDLNEWWSIEGSLLLAPSLDENFVGHTNFETGEKSKKSHAPENVAGFGDTWLAQTYADFLFHFTKWERVDPYLTFGLGVSFYGKDVTGDRVSMMVRAGGGVMYHLTEEWALRADARVYNASYNWEFNASFDVGFAWFWDAGTIKSTPGFDIYEDSDGDGLPDWYEVEIGTDPSKPDTDDDGLTDGAEVLIYGTDPLNPDSDFDWLSDGVEVNKYGTDPLNPDTDGGGVWDGHEVLVDGTDPLDPSDDAMLFELHIRFDTDKDVIKSSYFADLDKVANVLLRNPAGTALIEGHADQRRTSNRTHNLRLSRRRAEAVRNYLVGKGIAANRLKAVGHGFDRPKVANDPVQGNIANRRVDVYIYGVKAKERVQYVNPN